MTSKATTSASSSNKTKWSSEQKAIFKWFSEGSGHLVVRARAGTGKTTTIIEGIEHAPEAQILLAAFNKSIATELQKRIRNPRAQAKTLHGLGYSYVRRAWGNVDLIDDDRGRSVILAEKVCPENTSDEVLQLVAKCNRLLREIAPLELTSERALTIMAEFECMPDEGLASSEGATPEWIANRACLAAEYAKQPTRQIDFSDMIFLPVACNLVVPWFDLVVVDEAQDMTTAQLELATRACRRGGRLAIVGDDRQAIYGFRGADSGSLDRLKSVLGAQELSLTTTYRCPRRIVAIAAKYVPDYKAAPEAPEGIVQYTSTETMFDRAIPEDFILSRTNAALVPICFALLKAGRKATIKGRDIGKGLMKLVDRMRARTVEDLLARLDNWKTREIEVAGSRLKPSAAERRIDFVCDQVAVIRNFAEDAEVQSMVTLKLKLESMFSDYTQGAVICATTHKAKGLESNNVFLLQETFEYVAKKHPGPEEDNIYYVAVTRSKNRLVFVKEQAEAA
jgi:superfamily I DNA/RNA helicase